MSCVINISKHNGIRQAPVKLIRNSCPIAKLVSVATRHRAFLTWWRCVCVCSEQSRIMTNIPILMFPGVSRREIVRDNVVDFNRIESIRKDLFLSTTRIPVARELAAYDVGGTRYSIVPIIQHKTIWGDARLQRGKMLHASLQTLLLLTGQSVIATNSSDLIVEIMSWRRGGLVKLYSDHLRHLVASCMCYSNTSIYLLSQQNYRTLTRASH